MSMQQLGVDGEALLGASAGAGGLDRRGFVRAALGTGFAAAALPVCAQTVVKTSAEGLDAGEVQIPVGDFRLPAYRAVRQGLKNAPVVLVVSEIFGVHEHIADVARRLAHQGYCALAPQLFVRQGDAGGYTEIARLMSEVIAKVPDAQVCADLDATLAFARASGHADAGALHPAGTATGLGPLLNGEADVGLERIAGGDGIAYAARLGPERLRPRALIGAVLHPAHLAMRPDRQPVTQAWAEIMFGMGDPADRKAQTQRLGLHIGRCQRVWR